jgi:hypothetical protein
MWNWLSVRAAAVRRPALCLLQIEPFVSFFKIEKHSGAGTNTQQAVDTIKLLNLVGFHVTFCSFVISLFYVLLVSVVLSLTTVPFLSSCGHFFIIVLRILLLAPRIFI